MLLTRVFTWFEPERLKVVERPIQPSAAGIVTVPPFPADVSLRVPYAVIARIQNSGSAPIRVTLRVADVVICSDDVSSGVTSRIDCQTSQPWLGSSARVSVAGPPSNWSLQYLEIATHHGATRNYDLVIVPGAFAGFGRPGVLWGVIAFLSIAALLIAVDTPDVPSAVALGHVVLSSAAALILVLAFLSSLVSPYRVLLSARSLVGYVAIFLALRLWSLLRSAIALVRARRWTSAAGGATALLIVLGVYGAVFAGRLTDLYHGNYSGFLQISRTMFDNNPTIRDREDIRRSLILNEVGGYDAAFYYFQIYDPFLRQFRNHPEIYRQFIDAPPYRFGRIGFSLLVKALSLDRWQWYARTMAWLVWLSIGACAVALSWAAVDAGRSALWGALVALIPGFWQSLQWGLPEPLAAALLLGGYVLISRRRFYGAAALLAASLLIRETGLIVALAIGITEVRREGVSRVLRFLLICAAPVAVWRLYVGYMLFSDWGMQGFMFSPHNFDVPLRGMVQLREAMGRGEYFPGIPSLSRAGFWFPIVLTTAVAFGVTAAMVSPVGMTVAAGAYAVMALCLNFGSVWVHVGNAERTTSELFIMLALISVRAGAHNRLMRWWVIVFWTGVAVYLLFGSIDAQFIRDSLAPSIL